MEHWATVLDNAVAGLEGDREKVRDYAELLLERQRGTLCCQPIGCAERRRSSAGKAGRPA
jgi:hypothetical protein